MTNNQMKYKFNKQERVHRVFIQEIITYLILRVIDSETLLFILVS
jgi:hypothetical protein